MRLLILVFAIVGLAIFAGLFALSYINPLSVERGARELIKLEVEQRAEQGIEALSNSQIVSMAGKELVKINTDIVVVRLKLQQDLSTKIANTIANMLDADCECRRRLTELAQTYESEKISRLSSVRDRVTDLIEATYASVSAMLMREFRIVTGSNSVAFALLALTVIFRPRASAQLVLPGLVIGLAVASASGLYLFQQDWLHTLVFAQYMGFAYTAYLALLAMLLADILLNRARVTTRILNILLQALGSAPSLIPC